MARTSKRKGQFSNYEVQNQMADEQLFRVGIYARLSVDHASEKNESICNQIAIAKKYIGELPDMKLVDIYSDLGATGTNFERNGFQRLMQDIRQKKINCIVVKDFSRLGRNYIETGNYLEKIFPFMGVRLISVTDHYDSLQITDVNEHLGIHLKNIVNELYAKDIAIRVESTKMAKLKQGSYVGGIPSYGYTRKRTGDKNVLLPEAGTKDIVLQIYVFYGDGMGIREIIKKLYERKIHRPTEYRKTGHVYCQDGEILKQWSETTLTTILTNPVYIGTLVQKQGKSDHPVIVEDTHEALVPKDLFYKVAEQFESCKKSRRFHAKKGEEPDIFRGILYCGNCGYKLKRICTAKRQIGNRIQNRSVYGCPNIGRIDEQKCDSHYISMKEIGKILLTALEKEFSISHARLKDFMAYNEEKALEKKKLLLDKQDGLKRQIDGIHIKISGIYMKYCQKKITQETFLNFKQDQEKRIAVLKRELTETQMKDLLIDQESKRMNCMIGTLLNWKNQMIFDADLIHLLISRIDVYDGKRMKIQFNFQKEEGCCSQPCIRTRKDEK